MSAPKLCADVLGYFLKSLRGGVEGYNIVIEYLCP